MRITSPGVRLGPEVLDWIAGETEKHLPQVGVNTGGLAIFQVRRLGSSFSFELENFYR
jgi:hypothetical protein